MGISREDYATVRLMYEEASKIQLLIQENMKLTVQNQGKARIQIDEIVKAGSLHNHVETLTRKYQWSNMSPSTLWTEFKTSWNHNKIYPKEWPDCSERIGRLAARLNRIPAPGEEPAPPRRDTTRAVMIKQLQTYIHRFEQYLKDWNSVRDEMKAMRKNDIDHVLSEVTNLFKVVESVKNRMPFDPTPSWQQFLVEWRQGNAAASYPYIDRVNQAISAIPADA
jgi:hypothetical protein